ncbi:DUF6211 family protein [Streptacidiphilus sp. MAP5-3]|uniref:DUF6211 family protein n=1 Tax=unclassified Streptacidiphilus TaxID=2643834 RepID=UPI003516F5E2
MVFDPQQRNPRPGDHVTLRPGNSLGTDEHETFVVVDDNSPADGHLVLNLPPANPGRADWAAAVQPDEVAHCQRITEEGAASWTVGAGPTARQ